MGYTIDIDTGGTFTDGFFVQGDDVRTIKVATTPHDLTICFLECIAEGAKAYGVSVEDLLFETDIIRFSSTIGTNTIIQRDGSKIGLLVSPGLVDAAPTEDASGKSPLVASDMVFTLDSRISDKGEIHSSLKAEEVLSAAQTLIDRGARALLVCFENSELNPETERYVRSVVKREYPRDYLGSVPVFLASDISSHRGAKERLNTAVLNAYIHAKLARLLYKAGEDLRQRGYRGTLFVGHNNGAVARVPKTRAINTYNSGPAAGLLGAREIGSLYGIENLISTDMGGTSFDIGYVREGEVGYALHPDVEGFACNLPMMEIQALGIGGGSIAHVTNGELRVGPQSAGSLPGPACFDLGGEEPTVTDANLVLGVLDPDYFLGGSMKLKEDKARAAIDSRVATPLGISVEEAAWRIKQAVDREMGDAIASVGANLNGSGERVVIAYGGAGGLHACDIAAAAGVSKTLMTPFSAVSSAYSSSLMDAGHLYYRGVDAGLGDPDALSKVEAAVGGMWREAVRDMRSEGFDDTELRGTLQLFVRSEGARRNALVHCAEDDLEDAWTSGRLEEQVRDLLKKEGEARNGALAVETVALMVQAPIPHYRLPEIPESEISLDAAKKGQRQLFVGPDTGFVDAPIYDREALGRGATVDGPAIVEAAQTTILVACGWRMSVDKFNNAVLEEAK